MNLFYHITSRRNLESIQKEGLLPQYGYLSELVMEQRSAIYLFKELDEVRYAMEIGSASVFDMCMTKKT